MDASKIGNLIYELRVARNMTQKQLAERLFISDKTVSKWERGGGFPDLALLPDIAQVLDVRLEDLLRGEIDANDRTGGNMKNLKFYVCPQCGNLITAADDAQITCCGKALKAQEPVKAEGEDKLNVELIENEYFVSSEHEMSKAHHIRFIAQVGFDRVTLVRLYPEQEAETRLPRMGHGRLYIGCSRDGLFWQNF